MAKKKVFISYQRKYVGAITEFVKFLEADYDVWYDQKIGFGNWWERILEQICAADIVILALSRSYLESVPCKLEREYARALDKEILPVQFDHELDYNNLPEEIRVLQVINASDKAALLKALSVMQSPPLPPPHKMPPPPPVPGIPLEEIATDADVAPKRRTPYLLAGSIALVVIVLGVLALLLQADNPTTTREQPSPEGGGVAMATDVSQQAPQQLSSGAYQMRLLYGGENSFTIFVNGGSNLVGVDLTSSIGGQRITETLTARFAASLSGFDFVPPTNTCLLYTVEGTSPPTPLLCEGSSVNRIEEEIGVGEIWWYDEISNQFVDVFVRRGDDAPQFCGHASGSGNCEVSAAN